VRQAIISKIVIDLQNNDQYRHRVYAAIQPDEIGQYPIPIYSDGGEVELFLLSGCEHPEAAGYHPVQVALDAMLRKIKELTGETSTNFFYEKQDNSKTFSGISRRRLRA